MAHSRLVSVSIDQPTELAAFRAGLGARWTFLSDAERTYLDELGLREATDTLYRPYVPTTFTLQPDPTPTPAPIMRGRLIVDQPPAHDRCRISEEGRSGA